jgi:hypothetical protein
LIPGAYPFIFSENKDICNTGIPVDIPKIKNKIPLNALL